jgi:2-dehydropantoate 2-reductase
VEPIYVVGAGGIGCAVGYALCAAGARVVLVEADADKVRWGRSHGLRVDQFPPRTTEIQTFADWNAPPAATVLLCTKCYDNAEVLRRLPTNVRLIPIQNGFDPAIESRGACCEGIASFVSECFTHQTHTRITRAGRLHLGARGSNGSRHHSPTSAKNLPSLADQLGRAALFRVDSVADILPYKHTKLMYNAAISPLAAAAGLDNGQLLSVPRARHLFFELLRENYAILRHAGVALAKIGPFHPKTVDRILQHRLVARTLAWAFYPSLRGTYCSMKGDLPAGRTEIDNYNRYLIELSGNRPCPLNRRVYELVKRMERERIPPGVHMLDELDGFL